MMKYISLFLLFLALGGFVFAMFWDMPSPSREVEKTILIEMK